MKKQYFINSVIISTAIIAIFIIGFELTYQPNIPKEDMVWLISKIHSTSKTFGGDFLTGGYIQYLTYIAFWIAVFNFWDKRKKIVLSETNVSITIEKKELKLFLQEQRTLTDDIVRNIRNSIEDSGSAKDKDKLLSFMYRLCNRYLASKSIADTSTYLNEQVRIDRDEMDNELSDFRYLLWAIPSLGFIGTVIGIAASLGVDDIQEMKRLLSTAFDTTFVALLLSIIGMALYTKIEKQNVENQNKINEFLYVSFINKLQR